MKLHLILDQSLGIKDREMADMASNQIYAGFPAILMFKYSQKKGNIHSSSLAIAISSVLP